MIFFPVFNQHDNVLRSTAIRICFTGKTSLFSLSNALCRSEFIITLALPSLIHLVSLGGGGRREKQSGSSGKFCHFWVKQRWIYCSPEKLLYLCACKKVSGLLTLIWSKFHWIQGGLLLSRHARDCSISSPQSIPQSIPQTKLSDLLPGIVELTTLPVLVTSSCQPCLHSPWMGDGRGSKVRLDYHIVKEVKN